MLTISHRLATLMACDRVMVLAQGRVVEMGPPHVLSADPTSVFHEMTSNAAVAKAMLD